MACIRQNAPLPRLVPLMWWVPLSVLLNILVLVFSNISVLLATHLAALWPFFFSQPAYARRTLSIHLVSLARATLHSSTLTASLLHTRCSA